MAFPTSPVNNQLTTVNGVNYQYNSTLTAWVIVPNNSLFLQANAAFTQANSAYTLANTHTTYIQTTISPFLLMGA